jgi:hypothetical protein
MTRSPRKTRPCSRPDEPPASQPARVRRNLVSFGDASENSAPRRDRELLGVTKTARRPAAPASRWRSGADVSRRPGSRAAGGTAGRRQHPELVRRRLGQVPNVGHLHKSAPADLAGQASPKLVGEAMAEVEAAVSRTISMAAGSHPASLPSMAPPLRRFALDSAGGPPGITALRAAVPSLALEGKPEPAPRRDRLPELRVSAVL